MPALEECHDRNLRIMVNGQKNAAHIAPEVAAQSVSAYCCPAVNSD
jgi:hypothetical protein